MNLMLPMSFFSICHPLFYIINIFTIGNFLQRCSKNYRGFAITFTTINLIFFDESEFFELYASQPHIVL